MNAINLEEKLSIFSQHYQPRTVAQFNGHDVMVVKVKGHSPGINMTRRMISFWF